jgi:hypothetical protein
MSCEYTLKMLLKVLKLFHKLAKEIVLRMTPENITAVDELLQVNCHIITEERQIK